MAQVTKISRNPEAVIEAWAQQGGLITPTLAATILEIRSRGTITKWMDKGKLDGYQIGDGPRMLSYSQVMRLRSKNKEADVGANDPGQMSNEDPRSQLDVQAENA